MSKEKENDNSSEYIIYEKKIWNDSIIVDNKRLSYMSWLKLYSNLLSVTPVLPRSAYCWTVFGVELWKGNFEKSLWHKFLVMADLKIRFMPFELMSHW